ncbi:hypothetical protein CONPUDRAFT_112253 [Coniophora puteana RWD-64-598 SS2]|uniref:BRCT domain-containing protein n=1 Tax=Coniophora puteana (strain RWD-64-598) TaxID=741705 RepID=A0A5M3M920_CONPW|nr:uncharacterized protein CONPUDRAFT_112253 [Coniophora puteana RWD-64-598 SS2]EIW75709.1 hypothetical protein CONPUDRAFT_112253 [Coniophora puteana RWD-64-598 SS2]
MVLNKTMLPRYYSPDPAMIFSGIVGCATDIPAPDVEVLSAGICALGGQWRIGLTKDVTHLFAVHTGTDKYATAMHFRHMTRTHVVAPHWFEDSVRIGACMPEGAYEWPEPRVMQPGFVVGADGAGVDENGRRAKRVRRSGVDGAEEGVEGEGDGNADGREAHPPVWAGKKVMLSASLGLNERARESIEERIRSGEGLPVRVEARSGLDDEDEIDEAEGRAAEDCDVLVTKYRSGKAYFKALRKGILIGTLSWFFNVSASGTMSSAMDSLLWYPTPRLPISGFEGMQITITNYTGPVRDYLKRLIELTGAEFTPQMSASNKVLIAGYQPSPKAQRALTWSIPIVNHTWLEDCFVQWRWVPLSLFLSLLPFAFPFVIFPFAFTPPLLSSSSVPIPVPVLSSSDSKLTLPALVRIYRNLTVGSERYVVFPHGVDFGQLLAEAEGKNGIIGCRSVLPVDDVEAEEKRDREAREVLRRARERAEARARARAGALDGDGEEVEVEVDAMEGVDGRPARVARSPQKVPETVKSSSSPVRAAARTTTVTPRKSTSPSKPKPVVIVATPAKAAPGVAARMKTRSPAKPVVSAIGMSESMREVEDDLRMDVDADEDEEEDDDAPLERAPTPPSPSKRKRGMQPKTQSPVKLRAGVAEREDGDEEDEDGDGDIQMIEPVHKGRVTRSSPRKTVRREVRSETEEEDDDDDDEIPENLTKKAREQQQQQQQRKTQTQTKKPTTAGRRAVRSDSEEEGEEPAPMPRRASTSKAKTASPAKGSSRKKAAPTETSDSEVYKSPPKAKAQGRTTVASRMKARAKATPESEDGYEISVGEVAPPPAPKPKSKAQGGSRSPAKTKVRGKLVSEEEEEEEEETRSPSPPRPPAKVKSALRKSGSSFMDAVVITTPSPRKKAKAAADAGAGKRDRAGSLRAGAAESSAKESPRARRGQPSPAPKSPAKSKRKRDAEEAEEEEEAEAEVIVDTTFADAETSYTVAFTQGNGRARRSAAAKATTKLHDVIMPDVVSFEKERKNARRRGSEAYGYQESERSEYVESERTSAVGGGAGKGKGKRGRGENGDGDGEDSDVHEMPPPTASKARAAKRSKKDADEEKEEEEKTSRAKGDANAQSASASPSRKQVTILTTGVTLSDDVQKRLSKLGVRTTQTAAQCTHLVVKNVVRTEKFLSAMAVAPFIVTEEWAKDSAKAGTLLPEDKYSISDKTSEKKWNFKLADALERAKDGGGTRLFRGMVFYVTPKVPIDTKLLKNVVASGGGAVQTASPTVRSLKGKENRYVVSCPEDISIWRPIAQEGYPVYTAEMLLLAILRQEIGWEDKSTKVPGSY